MRSSVRPFVASLVLVAPALALPGSDPVAASGPRTLTLEELLPDDVLVFTSFAGLDAASAAAEGLGLVGLVREPEMQVFLADVLELIEQQAAGVPEEARETWEVARRQLGGRVSLALGDLTLVWSEDGPLPLPGMLVALDAVGHVDEVRQSFEMLVGMALAEADGALVRSVREHAGHAVTVLEMRQDELRFSVHAAFVENLVLLNLNGHLLDRCLDGLASGQRVLAKDAAFLRARSQSPSKPLVELFVDTAEIAGHFSGLMPIEVSNALYGLGLDSIDALYYASAVHDGDSLDTLYMDAPGGLRGLLALGGDRPVDDRALAAVPASAVMCAALSFDAAKGWDAVLSALESLAPPSALAELTSEIGNAESELGFALRDGLFAALGDELLVYAELPEYGFVPGVVLSVEMRDRVEIARILGTVLRDSGADVRQVAFGERTLHVITVPDGDDPVSPCFAFEGDRLLLGLTVEALKQALTRVDQGGPSVVDSPGFQSAFRGLDRSNASVLEYVDVPTLAAYGYDLALNFLPGVVDPEIPVDFAELPSKETLLRHLSGFGEVVRATSSGVVMQSRSLSFASLLALVARGLDELPALPFLARVQVEQSDYEWDASSAPAAEAPAPRRAPVPDGVVNPIAQGDPQAAEFERQIQQLTTAIVAAPKDGALYFNRAIRCGQLGRFDEAIEDYETARELGFRKETCAYNLACSYSLKGDLEEAFDWLERGFEEGFDAWDIVGGDSDLDPLRKDARFAPLVAAYRDGR